MNVFKLRRSTYYYEKKKITNSTDKYATAKTMIRMIFKDSHETYGHRRIKKCLDIRGIHLALGTVLKLMNSLNIKNNIYHKHTSKYSSYKGNIGTKAPNIINQNFNATHPFQNLHTDVTQVKLDNQKWGYISAVIDEATKEVMSISVGLHPDKALIVETIENLREQIPSGSTSILHSDQGWHYQTSWYQEHLKNLNFVQSMSRKGNCLDNAPIESFFSLLKRECLKRHHIHNIKELSALTNKYVNWFNNERISLKTKGLTPIQYRNQTLVC